MGGICEGLIDGPGGDGWRDLPEFAESLIARIADLFGAAREGLVCMCLHPRRPARASSDYRIVAASGRFAHLASQRLTDIDDPHVSASLSKALRERRSAIGERAATLFFPEPDGAGFAALLAGGEALRDVDGQLLTAFRTSIALSATHIRQTARLREFAFVDQMLGLPNRAAFIRALDKAIANGRIAGRTVGLIDIDQFVEINDMFGDQYGDILLGSIARRLAEALREHCLIARVAGDTFAVFGDDARVTPDRLHPLFARPFEMEGVAHPVSVCMGFVRCGEGAESGTVLLKNASIALKRAKAEGQGKSGYYSAAVGIRIREHSRLLHELHLAYERRHLSLVYQPQVSLSTGATLGIEALLRWRTEDGDFVPPDVFVPIAERSGLIVDIGAWVLCTALRALSALDRAGFPGLRMAINVSAAQFAQAGILEKLDHALDKAGIAPDRLELEITESVAVVGMKDVADLLGQIRQRGISVAIDDFGTGFSSLSYLDSLPADRLKIDRSFVALLDAARPGGRIAETIVSLGHRLDMTVLAEGVENEAQAAMLRALGCDAAQGYLYARPMPLEELPAWLERQQDSPGRGT
ncbi:MAG: hypothetical protein BGO63_04470 [Candidatus Accumulibacter sp. 66-26]|nr:EAL domain-containing protein [Accumulibacter sp.]OJW48386.1 MAG: hypothetical protein BGO63_04470 [Candidatus Accumulibacter sp. 66-26]